MLHIISTSAACPPGGAAETALISRGSMSHDQNTSRIPFSIQFDPKSRAKHLHTLCYIWSVWWWFFFFVCVFFVLHIHTGLHRLLLTSDGWPPPQKKRRLRTTAREEAERERLLGTVIIIWSRNYPACFCLIALIVFFFITVSKWCDARLVERTSASVDHLWLGLVWFERMRVDGSAVSVCVSRVHSSPGLADMLLCGRKKWAPGYEWPSVLEDPCAPGAWDMSLPMISFTTAEGERTKQNTEQSMIREYT